MTYNQLSFNWFILGSFIFESVQIQLVLLGILRNLTIREYTIPVMFESFESYPQPH